MPSYQYNEFHYKGKTIPKLSHLYNVSPWTCKTGFISRQGPEFSGSVFSVFGLAGCLLLWSRCNQHIKRQAIVALIIALFTHNGQWLSSHLSSALVNSSNPSSANTARSETQLGQQTPPRRHDPVEWGCFVIYFEGSVCCDVLWCF